MPCFVPHGRGSGLGSPMYVYRWEPMRAMLEAHRDHDGDPYEALMVEYVDPTRGGPVFRTMTFYAQMLRPGGEDAAASTDREPARLPTRRVRP